MHHLGANYEPPLTNVFTMQWFLTMFGTCLKKDTALRVWDCILLDGVDTLIRVAIAIWAKLKKFLLHNLLYSFFQKKGKNVIIHIYLYNYIFSFFDTLFKCDHFLQNILTHK